MHLGELLDQVRSYYLNRLAAEVNETDGKYHLIIEPAFRNADGTYATEGALELPCRKDLGLTEEGKVTKLLTVDTEDMLSFEPITFAWENGVQVSLHPFQWNYCPCEIAGSTASPNWSPVKQWFLKWFEETPEENGSLMRCVHFMSDPEPTGSGFSLEIDFGSAPVEAFEEFIDSLGKTGFQELKIG